MCECVCVCACVCVCEFVGVVCVGGCGASYETLIYIRSKILDSVDQLIKKF